MPILYPLLNRWSLNLWVKFSYSPGEASSSSFVPPGRKEALVHHDHMFMEFQEKRRAHQLGSSITHLLAKLFRIYGERDGENKEEVNVIVERYAAIGDTLDIVCPYFDENSDERTEQSIIYRVTEEEYENCERRSNAKELGRCTQPYQEEKLKVAFRLMSPNPSGLDYRPGVTYYFISTSTGSRKGLYNEQGGLCASHNLKMVIHITDRNGDIGIQHHRHHHHKKTTTTTTTTTTVSPKTVPATQEDMASSAEKLWEQFYEKVMPIDNKWPEVTRGERVTLYQGDKKDEYEPAVPADGLDFEIHEIGDVESLYSSTSRLQYLLLLPAVLLLRLL